MQNQAAGSVHENVVGYTDEHLKKYLDHNVDKTQNLVLFEQLPHRT